NGNLIDGLDKLLALLQSLLNSGAFAQNLPLIGSHLKDGAQAIEKFRTDVIAPLKTAFGAPDPKTVDFVKTKLAEVLGSFLLDSPDDADTLPGGAGDIHSTVTNDDIRFDFKIGFPKIHELLDFGLGLPGLGL